MAKDIDIINHAEKHGLTINQCHKIFFPYAKYGKDVARKRLKTLHENGHLKYYSNWDVKRRIYYVKRQPSTHDIVLMDFFAELLFAGADIIGFSRPSYDILKPDGLFHYIINGKELISFVEVVLTHKPNMRKYEALKGTGKLQAEYGTFPSIIIIDDNPRAYRGNLKVRYLDLRLKDFKKVITL